MNVKQGDVAIIIKSILPENAGLICTVEGFHGDTWAGSACWIVKMERPSPSTNGTGYIWDTDYGLVPDAWLRPISGLPAEQETEKEKDIKIEFKKFKECPLPFG